ncbi:hypothetical protein OIY81_1751 [Cryptosporidium canis]|uniref:Uncharacterized protein n=1 Tax=Cryptosporidium canis TaxID=195482 RepID=A0ABQ8P868_9CRYT|nr:hypothetical protein OIY81_1751 [Cryptosporidium canis]KAJ1611951.1 hypothetical protein OJ252_1404 [Cryptosporidium canis]
MMLSSGNRSKGIKNEWGSKEVIPYIREQLAEIRSNAIRVVEEAFSEINGSKETNNIVLNKDEKKEEDLSTESSKENITPLKCSQLELLKFLQYSNAKLSKYNIQTENIHMVN